MPFGRVARLSFPLYVIGAGLILLAWIFGNPPGAAPDEPSHYIRAMGAGQGDIFGRADPYQSFHNFNQTNKATPAELRNLNAYVRGFRVPAGLAPTTFACNAFEARVSAQCESAPVAPGPASIERSQHAGQPPLPYLLAGPVMVEQHSPQAADWAGRGILAVVNLLLLAVPLSMAGRFRARSIVALTVALTPMVFFTGAIFNPSGIETFASIGFFLALLAVADGRFPRGSLVAAGFTGLFLAMSRPFAPLWIVVSLVSVVFLVGPAVLWAGIRRRFAGSCVTASVIALGGISTLVFVRHFAAPPHLPSNGLSARGFLDIGTNAVGDFGWLETPLPPHAGTAWLGVIGVLTVAALWFGSFRERVAVASCTVLTVALTYGLSVAFLLPLGINPQGRHFLPILALQPLTSVIVLAGQSGRVRLGFVGVPAVLMLGLQFAGWISNGSRQSLGIPGPAWQRLFSLTKALLQYPSWSPPGGYLPWLYALVIGCLCLLVAAAGALASDSTTV